jgi:polar amino acid transport system substrate-binding protein
MKRNIMMGIIAVFLAFPFNARAEKLLFVASEISPPMVWEDENRKVVGSDAEVIAEICKRLGFECAMDGLPLKRALQMIERGEILGIFTIFRDKDREKYIWFSEEPINMVKTMVIARKDSGFKISSLDDLKGKRIGVIDGHKYGPEFDNYQGLKKDFCKEKEELHRMLDKGRVELILDSEAPFRFLTKKNGTADRFEMLFLIKENPVYIGFSKALGKKGEELAKKFSDILKQLKADGTYEKILSRYR